MSTGRVFLRIRLDGLSNGEDPVKAEISDAPIVFCLALTHSGLLCVSLVCRSFKKAWKASTFAMVGGMQRVDICSTGNQIGDLLVSKGVSKGNKVWRYYLYNR